ncbi:MAG: hypothetical protein ACKVS5_02990 [Parvularculaceae bacterium]
MQHNTSDKFGSADKYGADLAANSGANANLADRAGDLVHDAGAAALETGKHALHNVREKADDVKKDVSGLYTDGAAFLERRIAGKPLATIGIAMAAGALLSGLLFRRS